MFSVFSLSVLELQYFSPKIRILREILHIWSSPGVCRSPGDLKRATEPTKQDLIKVLIKVLNRAVWMVRMATILPS